jgi:hypothetical protein
VRFDRFNKAYLPDFMFGRNFTANNVAMLQLILITIILLALAFAGIAIKILVKKNGQFSGTCASNNPLLQEKGASCGVCGARPEEQCKAES